MEARDGEALPVVITSEEGAILDVTRMNRKGYTKSTERGELWTLNEGTGRLLPYREGARIVRLTDWGRWYEAVIREGAPRGEADESAAAATQDGTGTAGGRAGAPAARRSGGGAAQSAAAGGGPSGVIERLEGLIAARKRDRPEGSYTTYLFESGPEKIRKKTGEEAVELLLARDHKEIVSESADFIYHLLVLLCELDIPFSEVTSELERREGGR